jgi:hypothetical protein
MVNIMNCTEFNNYLNDGIDHELGDMDALDTSKQAAFQAHRASCPACQAVFAAEMRLLESLRAMPVPEPDAGFADRVLANTFRNAAKSAAKAKKGAAEQDLSQQHSRHHRQGFVVGFGSAAAAALAMWVVVGMSPDELPNASNSLQQNAPQQVVASADASKTVTKAQQPVLSIALNTQKQVKLAFASSEPLTGAKITIRLPDNVALVGYPGRRQLSWKTNLKKGDNLLSLPVVGTQVASGELVANIEYAGRVKTLRLNLETMAAGAASGNITLNPQLG